MADEQTTQPAPEVAQPVPAPAPTAPAPQPARVEQADHVRLILAQGQAQLAAAQAEAAKQAHQAALAALALAALRLENARRAATEAEDARVRAAAAVSEKYQVTDADQIGPDGAIWRKEPTG